MITQFKLFENIKYVSDYNNMIIIDKQYSRTSSSFINTHKFHFIIDDMKYDNSGNLSDNGNQVYYIDNYNKWCLNISYLTYNKIEDVEIISVSEFYKKYKSECLEIYTNIFDTIMRYNMRKDIIDDYEKVLKMLEQIEELKLLGSKKRKTTEFNL